MPMQLRHCHARREKRRRRRKGPEKGQRLAQR